MEQKISKLTTKEDWGKWRTVFTQLYIDQDHTLPEVMKIMEDKHKVCASLKSYKNKIKEWDLRKYFKADEAQQIVNGDMSTTRAIRTASDPEEARKRAARSLKRHTARQRNREANQTSPEPSEPSEPSTPPLVMSSPVDACDTLTLCSPSAGALSVLSSPITIESIRLPTGITEQFLFNLRAWTHEACSRGEWDVQLSARHQSGRRASRLLSSYLTSGITLFENGKQHLAFGHWQRAFDGFQSPNLFKSWYHDIPMRLLFEVGRVAHSGHHGLAAILLKSIKNWALTFLDESDCRRALFATFGELEVGQLRDLYDRAAKCMFKGLEARVDKQNHLLYEVRLNRALDMLWYDADTDLSDWLPQTGEVDQACGPNNYYSVYFLLLEAYRLVAHGSQADVDDICQQVEKRLRELKEADGHIDAWRVGLGYRRLGRQQFIKGRYGDARRSYNTAFKYVRNDPQLSDAVLIEICQRQVSMASAMHDEEDEILWREMLTRLEQQTKTQGDGDAIQRASTFSHSPGYIEPNSEIALPLAGSPKRAMTL
ncbi:hypothetical protein LTR99_007968 [Exophiala xenobiotica]|uniref:Clr5 domain-containing protein n=1 Tax=Vermiconidia calcicola TaxID=1690605 RepID=A0AAV9Q726_9PEZI|nr:hypothetical protein H2202_005766 [Exophiala xenobiotica]KAK5535062.1 hypothetical protein LTR25_006069 [Vermiconidia calcicola]KAK5536242.1 hypothetical protein LTR23_008104 [Chaetothyriales sp. CCFEE 6169]KAK5189388.1 hypothetical protein LTR92_010588 [Exophiala xenobiotica]KAK5209271.1 hypothetical protein LTR41_004806 [Exophiala xenobiotica]